MTSARSPDGPLPFFLNQGKVRAVDVDVESHGEGLRYGRPRVIAENAETLFDEPNDSVGPDGERSLFITRDDAEEGGPDRAVRGDGG